MKNTLPDHDRQHQDQEEDEESEDRLSNLPDSILHHILSFLPTLTTTRLSALSSHFRHLSLDHLLHTPSLHFSSSSPSLPHSLSSLLLLRLRSPLPSPLRLFRLTFNPGPSPSLHSSTSQSLLLLSSLSLEILDLDFVHHIRHHFLSTSHVLSRHLSFELSADALSLCSRTLTCLRLSRCILPPPPNDTDLLLPRLTSLHLRDVHVSNSTLDDILASSPELEELVLRECGSLTRIRVVGCRLRSLSVYECSNASVIEVSGREIRSVFLSAGHLDACVFEDVELLEDVFIGTRGDEFGGVLYIFMEAFTSFSHVQRLALYLGHLVPSLVKDLRVDFCNLKVLELVNSPLFGLFSTDVFCFFSHCSCPVLESVTVELCTISNSDDSVLEFRTPKVKPPKRTFNHLKNVKLLNFGNNKTDIELARYFLKRAPVLDALLLVAPRRSNHEKGTDNCLPSHVNDKILRLPKNSPSVKIVVREDNEHDSLLHFLTKHHVADVYYK